MEMETRAESIVLDQAENQSLLGLKFGALINLENSVFFSKIAVIETPIRYKPALVRRGSNALRSIETARVHHPLRDRGRPNRALDLSPA
jgi:hypothetical protein